MGNILICTMGYSPGVVTKMVQYLQEKEKLQLSEVVIVSTNNSKIIDLYNTIIRKEFDQYLGLKDVHYLKTFPPEDVRTTKQIEQFFEELVEFLKEKLVHEGNVVHLCISGGRKSMTYAMAIVVQAVAAELGMQITTERLHLWHIQLEREEEPTACHLRQLIQDYRDGFMTADRELFLYPKDALLIKVPFIHFEQPQRVEQNAGKYRFSRNN